MKATQMRTKDGAKFETHVLEQLCQLILAKTAKAGFITDASVESSTSINIGLHMRSFRINIAMLGHNARPLERYNSYGYTIRSGSSPKGYKRTDVPTWDQRVEFNNIVNACLDQYGVKARVVSGAYTVRTKDGGAVRSWNEGGDRDAGWSGHSATDIMQEQDMRDELGSDALEAAHKAAQAPLIRERAKQRRLVMAAFLAAKKVTVAGLSNWPKQDKRNGKKMTHAAFNALLLRLDRWQAKRVKKATIEATTVVLRRITEAGQ